MFRISIAILLLIVANTVFANGSIDEISSLIDSNLRDNVEEITTLSSHLPPDQKALLFGMHKKDGSAPALFNFFLGFGIGSGGQQDPHAGEYFAWGLGGLTSFAVGLVFSAMAADAAKKYQYSDATSYLSVSEAAYLISAISTAVSHFWGAFGAYSNAQDFNRTLGSALLSTNP